MDVNGKSVLTLPAAKHTALSFDMNFHGLRLRYGDHKNENRITIFDDNGSEVWSKATLDPMYEQCLAAVAQFLLSQTASGSML